MACPSGVDPNGTGLLILLPLDTMFGGAFVKVRLKTELDPKSGLKNGREKKDPLEDRVDVDELVDDAAINCWASVACNFS